MYKKILTQKLYDLARINPQYKAFYLKKVEEIKSWRDSLCRTYLRNNYPTKAQ